MAARTIAKAARKPRVGDGFIEYGASGLKQYSGYVREEWLPDLIGRKGLLKLREMRDNDPIIGAIFFAFEMLLRGVSFHVEGGSSKSNDQEAADFVEGCLGDMELSWSGLLAEILTFLQYGWDVHEIVYKLRRGRSADPKSNSKYDDGLVGWRKMAHRGQETLLHWIFNEAGDATHLVQLLPTGGPLLQVPLDKCLHFLTTPIKANPEGRSIMRNAYSSYYFRKIIQEIEAIGISRDLTGMPVMYVPSKWTLAGATESDKASYAAAKSMVRDVSRNDQEGLVIPTIRNDKGELDLELKLLATGGRRQIVTNEIIVRYDQRIAATVLADFITLGGPGQSSRSNAQAKNKTDIFSVAAISFLDMITAEFNRKAIPDLLALNAMDGEVQLVHGDIQRRDLQELGTYILDAFSAGMLTPDAALEAHIREEGGLPAPEQDSMRDLSDGGDTSGDGGDDDPADSNVANPKGAQGQGNEEELLAEKRRSIRKSAARRAARLA